jgi:putative ABC transport system substrate-binding protein
MLGVGLGPKRLELLHELIPAATSFGFLVNPANPVASGAGIRDMQAAAETLGLNLQIVNATSATTTRLSQPWFNRGPAGS